MCMDVRLAWVSQPIVWSSHTASTSSASPTNISTSTSNAGNTATIECRPTYACLYVCMFVCM